MSLRIYFILSHYGTKNKKNEENYMMRRFMFCAPHQTVFHNNKNIIPMTKSRRMRWVGNVARMSGITVHTGFRCDNEMERVFGGTILEFSGGIWEYQEKKPQARKALGQCSDALCPQYETEHPDVQAAVKRTKGGDTTFTWVMTWGKAKGCFTHS
jgi:hypothetical protein